MAEATQKAKKGPGKVATYFREMKSEFKKIVWPSFKQVKNNTGVVITFIILLGVFISLIDLGFTYLLSFMK